MERYIHAMVEEVRFRRRKLSLILCYIVVVYPTSEVNAILRMGGNVAVIKRVHKTALKTHEVQLFTYATHTK